MDRLDAGYERAAGRVREAQKKANPGPADPVERARADRELTVAKIEAAQAEARARLAGSGEPGDTPKRDRVGTIVSAYV